MENKLTILCGLPSSGKSTYAESIKDIFDYIVISSDAIREEISFYEDQSKNAEVFQILHKRVDKALSDGKNVIVDATNINVKSRRPLIELGKKHEAVISAIVFVTPLGTCYLTDMDRPHSVGRDVIGEMLRKFECPFYEEGFDNICFRLSHDYSDYDLSLIRRTEFSKIDKQMENFDQYNPYHKYTLGVHCKMVYDKFIEKVKNGDINIEDVDSYGSFNGVKYHDIGKLHTRKFDEDGIAHYYNHENLGAYYYLSSLYCSSEWEGEVSAVNNAFIVNYHMRPFGWKTDKAIERAKKLFGEEKFHLLEEFNKIDNEC